MTTTELEKQILEILENIVENIPATAYKYDNKWAAKEIVSLIEQKCQEQSNEIKKLKFMIDNGLGWEDMRNDITMPHEI